jgi:carboxyl-terminal processing protease|tara:strand:- start:7852 stop:9096 length:1245 start_codon:yes stop_codon:yes gene_type:complete
MNKYSSKQKNIFILAIFSIVFFILGYLISFIFSDTENSVNEIVYEKISRPQAVPENLETLWEAYNFINDEYYDRSKIDDVKMNDETIKSLIKTLDDKHSSYVSPEKWQITSTDLTGSYQGIGAYVDMANDQSSVVIVSPISGGPAEKVGIKGGDKILEVDGVSIIGMSLNEAINLIRGPEGSSVTLKIERLGEIEPFEITVIREKIKQSSVQKDLVTDTNYAKIRINQYTENTPTELIAALDEAINQDNVTGIILDIRNNPGGLLGSAVNATALFLNEELITYEIDAKGKKTLWKAGENVGKYSNIPLVTLVNGSSASGSEVMAGALQDYGRSVIIGEKTYGKGSVSLVRNLSNGGGMFLTNAHWFTPNGREIHDVGIEPDVVMELPESSSKSSEFYDTQIEAAITQLNYEIKN